MKKALVLFCLLLAPSSPLADQAGVAAVKHHRLIWTADPQTRAVVCWDTASEGSNHRVYYDTVSRRAVIKNYRAQQVSTANAPYSDGSRAKEREDGGATKHDLYYHHAQLTGLKPGTTYYFVVASGSSVSREFHFITAPAADEALKIIFGGDSRSGIDARRKMNRRIAAMAGSDGDILAFAHGGDYVGNGTNLGQWKGWMKDHELTITAKGRLLPLIPARGNHEGRGPNYDQVLAFPGGQGKNYFATYLSPEILFLTLNTETKPDGQQLSFLKAALRKAARARWRVTQYHRPVYPAVKGPGAGLKHWVPLFEEYNVALACEADGHCIKRTVPIRNGKQDSTGVVYIGEGGLGVGQRMPKQDRWYIKPPGMAARGHHVQLLSFTKGHLAIEVVDIDGKVLDTHSIATRKGAK